MNYKIHELAECFAPMSSELFSDVVRDMELNGFDETEPIELYKDKIIDGRNRYFAAKKAEVEPVYVDMTDKLTDDGLFDHVLRKNLHRRHMEAKDRREIFSRLRATSFQHLLIKTKLIQEGEETDLSYWDTPPDEDEIHPVSEYQPQSGGIEEKLAKELGVTTRSVKRHEKLTADAAPEVKDAYMKGDIGLRKAESIAKEPKEEQAEKLAEAKKPSVPKPSGKSDSSILHDVRGHWGHVVRGLHSMGLKDGLSEHLNAISKAIKKGRGK